jgi:hypothetical protein
LATTPLISTTEESATAEHAEEQANQKRKGFMQNVEVKHFHTGVDGSRVYGWEVVTINDALKMAEPVARCLECQGAIRLIRGTGGEPDHAEHRKRNTGCSLGDRFEGTKSMAEKRIE